MTLMNRSIDPLYDRYEIEIATNVHFTLYHHDHCQLTICHILVKSFVTFSLKQTASPKQDSIGHSDRSFFFSLTI